ncbi:polysaccharide biosynthesis/export family protein [Methylobacterium nigriterrae]|uniref:polysaccharide biosynthesis/export family protein n=1 Tax=Methylobacterium nigriterrae TaxID=3127512 RepID=UPI0030141A85
MKMDRCSALVRALACLAICASVLFSSTSARAAYLLQSGDVLELVVAGVPELRQRSTVGIDGEVSFPIAGQLTAAGTDISDLQSRLLAVMASKVYQQRTTNGREVTHVIEPGEISVSVVAYRQIYLSGDVARPGEQPYRNGMTVRQAIAVAGGYDVLRRVDDSTLQSSDLRAEYESLSADYVREQARERRVRMELGEKPGTEPANPKIPVASDLMRRLAEAEDNQFKARTTDLERERKYLQDAIQTSVAQLGVLAEKRNKDEANNKADIADFEQMRDLFQRGVTVNVSISASRRAVLLSSTQILRTIVETSNIERQRTDYERQMTRLLAQRRQELLRELQDTNVRVAQLNARLRSVGEKLLYSSTVQSQLIRGTGAHPDILVHRLSTRNSIPGDENTELQPGDTVSVALRGGILAVQMTR